MKAISRAATPAAIAAVVLSVALVASPAVAEDYPSWSDVQAAKASQAATQSEVDHITSLIGDLQTKAARLGGVAVQRAAAYAQARQALATATEKAQRLEAAHEKAEDGARKAKIRLGKLTGELYRSGGAHSSLHLFLSGDHASDLLYKLGAMSKLTSTASLLRENAQRQDNLAKTLSRQASDAREKRDALADQAEKAAEEAQAAADAADAEVAAQKDVQATLYAQLASLKNTTAQVERDYLAGERERASYTSQPPAGGSDGGSGGSGGSGDSSGGSGGTTAPPPSGIVVDPAAARAYAQGRIGAYGWGSDQFQCLIVLWNQESGWRADAYNTSSGAYGIPQSLPGSKMASAGADWRTNAATQINWGLGYIAARYGSPCAAWDFHLGHNWY